MPRYTHGGDDEDKSSEEPPKKPFSSDKFWTGPDMNIRDSFWAIMASYAAKKNMKSEIAIFSSSRTSLMKIALSVLTKPDTAYYDMSLSSVSLYSLMMFLDGKWENEFRNFLTSIYHEKVSYRRVVASLRKLLASEEYREQIISYLRSMISLPDHSESALSYIANIKDSALIENLKKELLIIARNDVEVSQRYAMSCLMLIKDQPEVIALISQLLIHWDELTRKHAANLLKDVVDPNVLKFAKSQVDLESNPKIKKLLQKIIEKNESKQKNQE